MAKGYSKQVSDRAKASRALVQSLETNSTAIVEALESTLSRGAAKPKKLGDLGALFAAMGELVGAASEALEAADQAHELEMADDVAPRDARDVAAGLVREVMVDLRSALVAAYAPAALRATGLAGSAPQDPQVLLTYGKTVLEGLAQADLGAPKRAGLRVDVKAFSKDLGANLAELEASLSTVAREVREGEATLSAKTKALTENDRVYQRAASAIEALARLGGREDIADKVRPSTRRPGLAEEGTVEPQPTPQT